MKKLFNILIFTLIIPAVICCDEEENSIMKPGEFDSAPSPPREVFSEDREELLIIWWAPNPESDISHYHVMSSGNPDGDYDRVGTVEVDPDTIPFYYRYDYSAPGNGERCWYGVTAVDYAGNESFMSYVVTATPGNEGGLRIYEKTGELDSSGFDISGPVEEAQSCENGNTELRLEYRPDNEKGDPSPATKNLEIDKDREISSLSPQDESAEFIDSQVD